MLKFIKLTISGCFASILLFAQKNDLVTIKATYKVTYTANKTNLVDDMCELDITKEQSFFYSLGKAEQIRSMIEKQKSAERTGAKVNFEEGMFKRNLFEFNTLKDYKSKLVTVIERVGFQQLGSVKDTLGTDGWKVINEKKKINNLNCRKAQIRKGGNIITVWFCADIPIPEGPLFYYGLPGLIIETESSNGWHTQLQSFENVKNPDTPLKVRKYLLVSKEQLAKAKKNSKAAMDQGILPNGDKLEKVNN